MQRRRREAPVAANRGDGAELRRAIQDRHRAAGFRRAGQRHRVVAGDVVELEAPLSVVIVVLIAGAAGAAVSMVTASAVEAALMLPATSVAVAVKL